MTLLKVEFFDKKLSPIIECLNVEFETGVFECYNSKGVMIRIALRWIDSNERDCSADMEECQRGGGGGRGAGVFNDRADNSFIILN